MIKSLLTPSLLALVVLSLFVVIPSAHALPVSYNQTALNFGLTSVPRNSSSYDVFPLIPDNWLWMKFDNNTLDSGPLNVGSTITYNSNLKALWKFQNTLTDSSTNGFTLTKAAGTTTYGTGAEGNSIVLDGSTYYTASASSVVSGSADRSFTFWMYLNSYAGGAGPFSYGAASANQGLGVYFPIANGQAIFFGYSNDVNFNTVFALHTWYHIGLTVSSSGTVRTLYVNGVQDSQYTTTALNTASGALDLGTNIFSSVPLNGRIDEFRSYNIAISAAQDKALYMQGHYGQSHTFDGGEYLNLGNIFSFTNTTPFTISLWVNKPSTATGGNELISKGGDGFGGYEVYYAGTTVFYRLWDGGPSHQITATATNDVYHNIAVTYDGSSNFSGMKLYIDGVLQAQGTSSAIGSFTDIYNLCIGISCGDFANAVQGQIDNVKIYPYALSATQITSDQAVSPISSGKQFMSYYNGISGSSTLTNKLGFGSATTTLLCSLNTITPTIISNMSNIYYECGNTVKKFDIVQNTNTHVYTSTDANAVNARQLFMGIKHIFSGSSDNGFGFNNQLNSEAGNVTQGGNSGSWVASNQQINVGSSATYALKFNDNSTAVRALPSVSSLCNINFNPSNLTKSIDSIVCDQAVPAMAIKYWNGMNIQKIGGYNTNTTQQFLNSADASTYKKLLTLPCPILGAEAPCITFILTDPTQTDYLVVLTSTHVYYGKAQTALTKLQNNNYALQTYAVITTATDSTFPIPNPILQDMTLYGFNLNTTIHKTGLMTLASGYSLRTTTVSPSIRLIDPRWSSDNTDIPIISTTSSLFPIFLTVSNAPQFSAIKVTQGNQIINAQESVWSIAQLDSTRSVEFDLPSGTCANTYIADISVSPSIWNFEGIICASGLNQKTISYTNTLPISFWTSKYSATHSYTPSSGILTVTTRATTGPYTENIIIKNSNGTTIQNYTNTVNGTIDTPSFNVTTVGKPLTLTVNINSQPIYYAFLGSAVSFASVSSFFATYFSYHGFNLLSLIPIIFAGMFTRNSVGIGAVAVVLLIASLNFFSLVVVPEAVITVMMFVSLIGLVAYRVLLY